MAKRLMVGVTAVLGAILAIAFDSVLVAGQSAEAAGASPQVNASVSGPTAGSHAAFEVASVKHHEGGDGSMRMDGPDPSQYVATNLPVKLLIEVAYGVKDFQVSGGPSWIESERFDINAKVDDSTAERLRNLSLDEQRAQKFLMLQTLLADRFKLQISRVSKELPADALVVVKNGPKLKEVPADEPASAPEMPMPGITLPGLKPGNSRISISSGKETFEARALPISKLVDFLSRSQDRMMIDQTGLKGTYDFTLQFAVERGPLAPPLQTDAAAEPSDVETLRVAIQDQLGLKLESTKVPVDTIVVDHVEEPTPN